MTTAPSTYFGFSDLSDGVTITPESRERLREEHDIVGMFLNLDKKSFDRIVDIGRKLREVISEEVPTAQANVHRLVQFEGFVNSKMELLPRHTFPNIYEVELRVGDYATHYPIVILAIQTYNSPRSDGYFQYYQSVDSGLTFLIEWLEEVQTEEQPQDKEK